MYDQVFPEDVERQAAAFDEIGASYEDAFGENATQIASVRWLLERLPEGARILDAGCGTGVPTAKLLVEAGCQVLGIDISREMLRIARRRVPRAEFQRMDIANLNLGDRRFHAITAFFSLLMLRKEQFVSSLAQLVAHLEPRGYVMLSMVEDDADYAPIEFLGTPLHFTGYPRAVLEGLLSDAGLEVVERVSESFTPRQGARVETQLFYRCQLAP